MQTRFSLVLAALAVSTVAFAQDGAYQIGYAANLNVGDSKVNISNDGWIAGPFGNTVANGNTQGNICANVYVFDPQEEEIGCCACLVTPDGLNSLSVQSDLISNNLTPAVPTSVVIKIVGSWASPGTGGLTLCNPSTVMEQTPNTGTLNNYAVPGLVIWGTTLEPAATPGTYNPVNVNFVNGTNNYQTAATTTFGSFPGSSRFGPGFAGTAGTELNALTQLCKFIQSNGTGYGICKSCRLGALGGAKQ